MAQGPLTHRETSCIKWPCTLCHAVTTVSTHNLYQEITTLYMHMNICLQTTTRSQSQRSPFGIDVYGDESWINVYVSKIRAYTHGSSGHGVGYLSRFSVLFFFSKTYPAVDRLLIIGRPIICSKRRYKIILALVNRCCGLVYRSDRFQPSWTQLGFHCINTIFGG